MAQTVQLKRSSVAGKIPLTTDLALGEIAINTFDGKLFLKRNNGTDAIREIGAVTVEKNGTVVGTRRNINFIEGTNITLTIAEDSANDEIDVTIAASGGGGGNLDSLTDVVITTPSNGQVLKYNGTNWINDTDATSGTGTLDGLSDVVLGGTALATGDVLYYNGTNWVNDNSVSTTIASIANILDPVSRQSNTSAIVAISVGTTAPSSPAVGDLWVDTN